jgi:hypothetical protein
MRRHRAPFMPLVALCRRHFSADFITNMSEFDFRQARWKTFMRNHAPDIAAMDLSRGAGIVNQDGYTTALVESDG